jgi:predicted dehydrogenase
MKSALIGAGRIARQHLTCLQGLPDVAIAAVCDLSPAAAESAAERHGVPAWFTDHHKMLADVRPDVVHITTPAPSHYQLALDCVQAGAHIVVEKPITETFDELETLLRQADERQRVVIEDFNYLFNHATREIAARIASGELGAVAHVEIAICISAPGPGGIAEFLPHVASLAQLFVGPHRTAHTLWSRSSRSPGPADELRAQIDAERGTAALVCSVNAQPDAFWLRVYGGRMLATANLWETRLTFNRVRPGVAALGSALDGLEEGRTIRRSARRTLLGKFLGKPGGYEGLFELLARTYHALASGTDLPVTPRQMCEVNRLVQALKPGLTR